MEMDINDIIDDIKFCKKTFGGWKFNRICDFYEGYILFLFDNVIINEQQYKKYNNMIYKTRFGKR